MSGKTFAEFFAGIGLVRLGLEPGGWRCVYANDFDATKRRFYEAQFGEENHFHLEDVNNVDAVVDRIDEAPFLATASFPCTDLSLAGRYAGLDGKHSSAFYAFASVLERLGDRKPQVVMLENVPGLLSSRKGKDFEFIARKLADLGYWVDAMIVDARHFLPQSRPRVFIFGIRNPPPSWRGEDGRFFPPNKAISRAKKTVELSTGWLYISAKSKKRSDVPELHELIDVFDDGDWTDAKIELSASRIPERHKACLDKLYDRGTIWAGTAFQRTRHGRQVVEVRFDGLAGCLRTPKGGNGRQIVIIIESSRTAMRWMKPIEYARLQGAPDYPLVGSTTQQLFAFADAVCVPVIKWLDDNILTPAYEYASKYAAVPGIPPA